MKFEVEAKDMTKEDLVKVLEFFADLWKERTDVMSLSVTEGTGDCSKEEIMELLKGVFKGRKHYTEVIKT